MKVDRETVLKVLALFDEEDIYYIHVKEIDDTFEEEIIDKPKVKVKGDKYDGPGKRD